MFLYKITFGKMFLYAHAHTHSARHKCTKWAYFHGVSHSFVDVAKNWVNKYKLDSAGYFITASNLLLSAITEDDMSCLLYPSVNYSEQKYGLLWHFKDSEIYASKGKKMF